MTETEPLGDEAFPSGLDPGEAAEEVADRVRDGMADLVRDVVVPGPGRVHVEGITDLLEEALPAIKDRAGCSDLLSMIVVDRTDQGEGLELVHHLAAGEGLVLLDLATRLEPGKEGEGGSGAPAYTVPSAKRLWRSSSWLEREAWDLSGVVFEGNDGMARLLLHEGWVGHPLRRDDARNRTQGPPMPPGQEGSPDLGMAGVDLPVASMGGRMGLEVRSVDGRVTSARVDIGHLHRGVEGLAEGRNWEGVLPLAARAAARSSIHWQVAYVLAVEALSGVAVPERGQAIRVALMELERISDHMLSHATLLELLGCRSAAARVWSDRELVMDAMQALTGQRIVHDAVAIGGVLIDAPHPWNDRLTRVVRVVQGAVRGYVADTEALAPWGRLDDLAHVHLDHMPGWGLTGPVHRATGVPRDARADGRTPHYGELRLPPVVRDGGDALARAEVRLLEMASSAKLLAQLARSMPGGHVRSEPPLAVHAGRAVGVVEDPRGELHCTVVSDGSDRPRRVHFRSPDLAHAAAMEDILLDCPVGDVALAVASLDICVGGIDR